MYMSRHNHLLHPCRDVIAPVRWCLSESSSWGRFSYQLILASATVIAFQTAVLHAQCTASSVVVQGQQTCSCNGLVINLHSCKIGSGTPQQGCNSYAGSVPCGQTTNNPPACNGISFGSAAACTPSGGCNVIGPEGNQQSSFKPGSIRESILLFKHPDLDRVSCASPELFEEWLSRHAGPS